MHQLACRRKAQPASTGIQPTLAPTGMRPASALRSTAQAASPSASARRRRPGTAHAPGGGAASLHQGSSRCRRTRGPRGRLLAKTCADPLRAGCSSTPYIDAAGQARRFRHDRRSCRGVLPLPDHCNVPFPRRPGEGALGATSAAAVARQRNAHRPGSSSAHLAPDDADQRVELRLCPPGPQPVPDYTSTVTWR